MSVGVSLLGPLRGAGGFCFLWDAYLTGVEVWIAAEVTKLLGTSHRLGPRLDVTCDLVSTLTALDPLPLPPWLGVLLPSPSLSPGPSTPPMISLSYSPYSSTTSRCNRTSKTI